MSEGRFVNQTNFRRFWLGGLLLFAITIAVSAPLSIAGVDGGILDHQEAATAQRVDQIHAAWAKADLLSTARYAMICDLVFIGLYSFGSLIGGLLFRRMPAPALHRMGSVIAVTTILYCVADYGETLSQFVQLLQNQGSDQLAGLAAFLRPIKIVSFLVTFVGILAGLLLQRRLNKAAI